MERDRHSINLRCSVGALACWSTSFACYHSIRNGADSVFTCTSFGPLGSACFFIAALWIELVWRKSPSGEKHGKSNVVATHMDEVLTGNVAGGEQ